MYIKPTDWHQYLHYSSSHPEHTKWWFLNDLMEIKSWFLKQGYPRSLVEKELGNVKFLIKLETSNKKKKVSPLLLRITWFWRILVILLKKTYLLYMNEEAKMVFTPGPMISFCSARKLSSYLVRAKLYPIEWTVRSFKCNGKRCQTCLNVNKTDRFISTTTGERCKINISLIVTVNTLCISLLERSV